MTPLKLITAPSLEPLTLAETKLYLRVDHDDEDAVVTRCAVAARQWADGPEGFLGRALIDQTWELTLDGFPLHEIRIPLPPLIEVINVFYDDAGGLQQIVDPVDYAVDAVSQPGWIVPVGSWPATFNAINSVRVRFRAGYVDTSFSPAVGSVPEDIKAALLLYAGTLFDTRETHIVGQSVTAAPWSAEQLLRRRRVDVPLA
jgi:uncharacterized phiE125 gp8 family phage protein